MVRTIVGSAFMFMVLTLQGCVGEIPFVGIDADGNEIETLVPTSKYVQRVSYGIGDVTQSVIPAVDSYEAQQLPGFREMELGLFLEGKASIGVISMTGSIGYELVFKN